jgi:ribosome-associated protein
MTFTYTSVLPEIWFEYVRSRGPGGQHVNKTNSAAILRWHVSSSQGFSEEQKQLIQEKLANHISSDGYLMLRSDQHRDQEQNRNATLEKLQQLIKQALFKPKKRIKTKPSRSSVRKRIESKKTRSETKKMRQKVQI